MMRPTTERYLTEGESRGMIARRLERDLAHYAVEIGAWLVVGGLCGAIGFLLPVHPWVAWGGRILAGVCGIVAIFAAEAWRCCWVVLRRLDR